MLWFLISAICIDLVWSHAALYEPPGRSSMWRFGFDTERNDDDMELFCGGITKLWDVNKGKCGICGDAWDLPEPRPHEDGGIFGRGIIARTYKSGQEITAQINVIANHFGYFEFKLCPVQKGVKTTQKCLDKHPIPLADGSGYRWDLGSRKGMVEVKLRLPKGLTCDRCVFQWHWKCDTIWNRKIACSTVDGSVFWEVLGTCREMLSLE